MKKLVSLSLVLLLSLGFVSGCSKKDSSDASAKATSSAAAATKTPDAVTTASIVNDSAAFLKAASKDGKWIICTLKDLTIDKEIVLEGDFKNGKKDDKGNELYQRKIALYTQDDKRNVTARFTLTAPKLTVKSAESSIQHGTFKGDVYVSVKNFQLVDATIDGNLYFTTDEAKSTFKMDDKSKVTGKQELKK